ncbi:MAG: UPF0182 family protein [Bacillota bacterium]|nr:UPF0182 family protein [Bacillota bacterium]
MRPRGVSFFTIALIAIGALGLLALFGSTFYTDWLWFSHLGFDSVFGLGIVSRIVVGLVTGLALTLFLWINLSVALAGRISTLPGIIELPIGPLVAPRRIRRYLLIGSILVGAFIGLNMSANWLGILQYLRQTPFADADPIFGRNVGFYVFSLPVTSLLFQYVMAGLVLAGIGVLMIYVLTGDLNFDVRRVRLTSRARAHVSLLVAGIFAAKALGYRITLYRLLYSPRGQVFGAAYTDVNAEAVALRMLFWIALGLAAVLLANVRVRRTNLIIAGVGLLIVVSFVLGTLYPTFVQQFTVEPDELNKESPYIAHNIEFTRRAWNLESIAEADYQISGQLTAADLQRNQGTVTNIRLWDYRPLQTTYAQLQELRLYYRFNDVDIDRYDFAGDYRQVSLSARELDVTRLPERTWMNQYLIYTHGFGVVMSPVNSATAEGRPELWIRDIPPVLSGAARTAGLEIAQPRIYFGELTNTYAIANTRQPEFDYPAGDVNATNHYDGRGGVRLSSPLVKLAFSLRFRDYQIFLANVITPESRLLMYRNITQRARRIAPFLNYDRDPYLVVADGHPYWIIDAYTMTGAYPYSEPLPRLGANYVRNSVKVVVDAFHGDITFYLFDPGDPLAATYASIFPKLFTPAEQMPAAIRAHVRYPLDYYTWQAELLLTYHMRDPVPFYNKEDVWTVPVERYKGQTQPVEPYYMIMRLPGEAEPEFVLLLPFVPRGKSNMVGWLAARSDGDNYGKRAMFLFPKKEVIFGPAQIEAFIDQDTEISRDLTLWGQRGSEVIRGNLLVIPIDGSILYVEPLYLQAEATSVPELKRVVVVYREKVVMAETLDAALQRIFGQGGGTQPPPGEEQTVAQLAAEARRLFTAAEEAVRRGDWAEYGRLQGELSRVIEQLLDRTGQQ